MRIGVNVSRYDQAVKDALLLLRPGIIVATDPVDWGIIAACKAAFECFVIYRPVVDGTKADNAEIEPEDLAAFTLEVLARPSWFTHGTGCVDAVQGYNEVLTSNNVATQGPRELAFVRAMAPIPVVALNPGVGNIEPHQIPMLQDVFREAAYIGYHGYTIPWEIVMDGPDQPYHLRRPELLWKPGHDYVDLSRVILTETGPYFDPPKTRIGWKACAELCIEIHEYALGAGMMGTAAFTLAGHEPWQTKQPWQLVEHPEALAVLAEYNRTHDNVPPAGGQPEQPQPYSDDNGGTAMPFVELGADIVADYPDQHAAWVAAGGWKNFASYMVATGQIAVDNAERRELVLDRLESATKEASEFLRSLPLA